MKVKQILKSFKIKRWNIDCEFFMGWKSIPEVNGKVKKAFLYKSVQTFLLRRLLFRLIPAY